MAFPQPFQQQAIVPATSNALALNHPRYRVVRSYWSLFGRTTRVFTPEGQLACFIKAKVFSWRGETTLYADEAQTQPMLVMKARQVMGFSINHDLFDPASGQRLGSVRNRGIGWFRDAWDLLDMNDQPCGEMIEVGHNVLRRFFPILRNGQWNIAIGGQLAGHIRERWTLFSKVYDLDLSMNAGRMDPRFALACAILCIMRESQREQR